MKKENTNSTGLELKLSRRERQIMDVVYRLEGATVNDIRDGIPKPPHNGAIRRMLKILEEKGHLKHKSDGPRHVYYPTVDKEVAVKSAFNRVTDTFFDGSPLQAAAALIDFSASKMEDADFDELQNLIEEMKKAGK